LGNHLPGTGVSVDNHVIKSEKESTVLGGTLQLKAERVIKLEIRKPVKDGKLTKVECGIFVIFGGRARGNRL